MGVARGSQAVARKTTPHFCGPSRPFLFGKAIFHTTVAALISSLAVPLSSFDMSVFPVTHDEGQICSCACPAPSNASIVLHHVSSDTSKPFLECLTPEHKLMIMEYEDEYSRRHHYTRIFPTFKSWGKYGRFVALSALVLVLCKLLLPHPSSFERKTGWSCVANMGSVWTTLWTSAKGLQAISTLPPRVVPHPLSFPGGGGGVVGGPSLGQPKIFRCGSLCCCVGGCVVGHYHLHPLHSWQDILLTFAEMELDNTTMFPVMKWQSGLEIVQEFKVKWSRTKKFYTEPVKE